MNAGFKKYKAFINDREFYSYRFTLNILVTKLNDYNNKCSNKIFLQILLIFFYKGVDIYTCNFNISSSSKKTSKLPWMVCLI